MGAVAEHQTLLLERDAEVARLRALLAAAGAGVGGVLVVEGAAGIGKSELLKLARREAAAADHRVLAARGSELEQEFAHGIVRQLLEPALLAADAPARDEILAGAAALAAPVVDPREAEPDDRVAAELSPDAGFSILHGLYWVCANLARRSPLLVAVDDAHWADVASLRFLAYLARRLDGLPIALLVARRPGGTGAQAELLDRIASDDAAEVLRPPPLSDAAVGALVGSSLDREPQASFAAAVREATGGVPFLVLELLRDLHDRRLEPTEAAAASVIELRPGVAARAIATRLARLAPAAAAIAHAVAVLGGDATPARIARLLDVEHDTVLTGLDVLVPAEILLRGETVDFVHPLVRAAVEAELPAAMREKLHARAAALLHAEGAQDERIAAHVLSTHPSGDAGAAELLLRAGRRALAAGATTSAVAYLTRAAAEPPPPALVAAVLHELGRAYAVEGGPTQFESTLRRARAVATTRDGRARIGLDLGRALASAGDFAAAVDVLDEALRELGDGAGELAVELESELYTLALNEFSALRDVFPRLRRRIAELDAGKLDHPLLLGPVALAVAAGRPPASTAAKAAEGAAADPRLTPNTVVPGAVGNAFLFAGRLERAAAVFAAGVEFGRERGARQTLAFSGALGANVALHRGQVARAEEDGRFAFELMQEIGVDPASSAVGYAASHLAEVLVAVGAYDDAGKVLAEVEFPPPPVPRYAAALLYGARSRLRLAQGRYEEALADAEASAIATRNPAVRPWRSDAAHALARLGRGEEGARLAADELESARAFDVPEAVGVALRALAACRREAELDLLQEAVEVLAPSEAKLEHARALADLGAALRRGGRRAQARDRLREALDLADRCGAAALAEQVRVELLATGARPRRLQLAGVAALTPSERRVADLAARGATNREIAQALFVTARTVEGHLTHVFQKLGIDSRAQLAERLAVPER